MRVFESIILFCLPFVYGKREQLILPSDGIQISFLETIPNIRVQVFPALEMYTVNFVRGLDDDVSLGNAFGFNFDGLNYIIVVTELEPDPTTPTEDTVVLVSQQSISLTYARVHIPNFQL
uniref:Uncharacterized protein n=1 Tax=Panagrolaimus davidi TaxID=227884 RepID=A0A914Q3X8_9BILA